MGGKDYYLVLGVPRNESERGIRSAFRDLARRHHPDRAGPAGTPAFRDVVEAYRVLSDRDARRAHDAGLRALEHGVAPGPLRRRVRRPPPVAEPLASRGLFDSPAAVRPSAEALLDHILRNFEPSGMRKGELAEPLLCDVALSRSEAARGGILPVRIPIRMPCPICHGVGRRDGFACRACDARGAARSEVVVPLEIPPRVRPGTVLETTLEPWGIGNVRLHARIGVVG